MRTGLIQIRVEAGEKEAWQLEAKEANMTLGDYVRSKMARPTRRRITPPPVHDPALVYQVQKIGTNLNQLVRLVHEHGFMPEMAAAVEAMAEALQLVATRREDTDAPD